MRIINKQVYVGEPVVDAPSNSRVLVEEPANVFLHDEIGGVEFVIDPINEMLTFNRFNAYNDNDMLNMLNLFKERSSSPSIFDGLSDNDKLSIVKSRYIQSYSELYEYYNSLAGMRLAELEAIKREKNDVKVEKTDPGEGKGGEPEPPTPVVEVSK